MGKVTITIRLYKRHDLDLITFMETHEFHFQKAAYCALNAFANNEAFVIKIPPRKESLNISDRKIYCKGLRLDEEKDEKILYLIRGISNGYRNNFVKNILRMYLCTPISEEFLMDKSRIDEYEEKFEIFKKNKPVRDAGSFTRKQKKKTNEKASVKKKKNKTEDKNEPMKNTDGFQVTESKQIQREEKPSHTTEKEKGKDMEMIHESPESEILEMFHSLL